MKPTDEENAVEQKAPDDTLPESNASPADPVRESAAIRTVATVPTGVQVSSFEGS